MTCILVMNANKHGSHRYDDGVPGNKIKVEDKAHQFVPASLHISFSDGLLSLATWKRPLLSSSSISVVATLQLASMVTVAIKACASFMDSCLAISAKRVQSAYALISAPRAKSVVRSTARPAGTVQLQTFTYHRYLNSLCSCIVSISVIQS